MVGYENGVKSYYSEPHYEFILPNGKDVKGTIRSVRCKRAANVGAFSNHICINCQGITRLNSFKCKVYKLSRKTGEKQRSLRYCDMGKEELLSEARRLRAVVADQEKNIFLKDCSIARLKAGKDKLTSKLTQLCKDGSFGPALVRMKQAADNGYFSDKKVLEDMILSIAKNSHVKGPQGNRYGLSLKLFCSIVYLKGSRSICRFVSNTLKGPSIDTIDVFIQKNRITLKFGIDDYNFKEARNVLKQAIEKHGVTDKIPVLLAEDETGIQAKPQYFQETDEIIGFCGLITENAKQHRCCTGGKGVLIGDDPGAYERIEEAFTKLKLGSYLRVIMVNPLHKALPKIIVFATVTCNMFESAEVSFQWKEIERLYQIYLYDILGPIIGHSSDGDSRRRKLMLEMSTTGNFRPIPLEKGFLYCATTRSYDDEQHYTRLSDQDSIHNHKKLINPLEHPTRVLRMGPYMVHSTHLQLLRKLYPHGEHSLRENDILRRDRQNWESAQRISSYLVQESLDYLIKGVGVSEPNKNVLGTKVFLQITAKYVDIFFSPSISNFDRVRYGSCVANFLGIWRNYIIATKGLTLKENFITREGFMDVILSIHFVILLMCEFRENYPTVPLDLSLTGSQCLEDLFSEMGSWSMNKRTYNGAEALRTLRNISTLKKIRVNPDAPQYTRPAKQEDIWYKQYLRYPYIKPCWDDFPNNAEMIQAWDSGIEEAKEMATQVEMKPNVENSGHRLPQWFTTPLGEPLQLDKMITEQEMADSGESPDNNDIEIEQEIDKTSDDEEVDIQGSSCASQCNKDTDDEEENEILNAIIENERMEDDDTTFRHRNQILVPGAGHRFKSTVVNMFAVDSKLAKDRLQRVRQRQYTGTRVNVDHDSQSTVSKFDDLAIYVPRKQCIMLIRAERFIKQGKRSKIEYNNPIDLSSGAKGVVVLGSRFSPAVNSSVSFSEKIDFVMERSTVELPLENCIMKVKLNFDGQHSTYQLDYGDRKQLEAFIVSKGQQKRKGTSDSLGSLTPAVESMIMREHNETIAESGRRVVTVSPERSVPEGTRRSRRQRRKVIFDHS